MTADLSALIARLEAAEVGSREMDAHVEVAARAFEAAKTGLAREHWAVWRASSSGIVGDGATQYASAAVTTSLDAALALAERVLEGWAWQIDRWGQMTRITLNECDAEGWHRSKHLRIEVAVEQPPAIALCIATLRAKQGGG